MTPNEQLASVIPKIFKRIARAKFLHEGWVVLPLEDVELLADAAEEFLKELILPEVGQ